MLCLDRTNWQVGRRDVNILMLAVATRRLRLPLMWTVLDKAGSSNQAERIALMRRYLALFGAGSVSWLLADREFIGGRWIEFLLENNIIFAIRYTERGAILIGCRRLKNSVRLEVLDSGVGISPEHCDSIFEEFYQIKPRRMHKGALGLGLSIAKRIADILEHRLVVRSKPNEGSIFSIELPVGNIMQSDIGEPEINEKIGGEFFGLSILVLEDDEILRDALTELLERWGINVKSFNSFDDLATHLREAEFRPDLIITDYRLHGGLNGDDVVNDIRSRLELDAPAIVVTADTDPKLIEGVRADGFPVLIKPVSPPRLRVMMHNILYEPELVRELKAQPHNVVIPS